MTVDAAASAKPPRRRRRMWDVIAALGRPRVALMLVMGVSSGLPFMLIGNTLGFWLADDGIKLAAIGLVAWVGMTYTVKFIWGALVDRIKAPLIGRMGRRRSWMLIAQVVAGGGLIGMGFVDPRTHLGWLVAMAIVAAVGAATQDTAMDAWRIEIAADADELGLLTAAYTFGYKFALILTEAVILMVAKRVGWPISYMIYGAAIGVGVIAVLLAKEPAAADAVMEAKGEDAKRHPLAAVWDAVVGPLVAFFRGHGVAMAALMLLMITFYHLCDYMRGPMINPYYSALHLDKDTIAWTRLALGTPAGFIGVVLGGLSSIRLGNHPTLIVGAVLQPIAVAAFAPLGFHGGDYALVTLGGLKITAFQAAMTFDPIAMGYAGVALVAYMSTLTSLGYTATQYALLTSALALTGKFLKGFSGAIVDALHQGRPLLAAFADFYLLAAALGLPAILLCLVLARQPPTTPGAVKQT
ncbi:MAG TPA: MFS transporter [Caulobacteraceae bacterium]|jgi:PAT family beta-lactamase induction signal transducer AmpG